MRTFMFRVAAVAFLAVSFGCGSSKTDSSKAPAGAPDLKPLANPGSPGGGGDGGAAPKKAGGAPGAQ